MVTFTRSCSPMEAGGGRVAVGRRSSIRPLQTRKLRCPFLLVQETISLLVMRAPGGKLDFDGGVGGEDFEEAAALHRVDVTADEQEETAAAV